MDIALEAHRPAVAAEEQADAAPFIVRGMLIEGNDARHRSRDLGVTFTTPKLDLDLLIFPRTELPPLLIVPLAEIIDFLVEAGQRMCDGKNPYVEACIDRMAKVSLAPRRVVEYQIRNAT